jgi:hypothetical protein
MSCLRRSPLALRHQRILFALQRTLRNAGVHLSTTDFMVSKGLKGDTGPDGLVYGRDKSLVTRPSQSMSFSLIPDLGGELSNAVVVCRCATRCWKGAVVVCFARGPRVVGFRFSAAHSRQFFVSPSCLDVLAASLRLCVCCRSAAGAHCVRLCFPKRSSHENEMARGSSPSLINQGERQQRTYQSTGAKLSKY